MVVIELQPQVFDFAGGMMSVGFLEMILQEINRSGGVTVKNVCPGTVNMLQIGATLAELARKTAEDRERENAGLQNVK